eukprot:645748-Heterocapsa_arctica.AAC.1
MFVPLPCMGWSWYLRSPKTGVCAGAYHRQGSSILGRHAKRAAAGALVQKCQPQNPAPNH